VNSALEGYTSLSEVFKIAFRRKNHGRLFMVMTQLLESFLDESSDQEQKDIFCVAAFLANERLWKPLEDRWVKRLQQDHVKYFRASDCKAVRGAFDHLRKEYGSFLEAKKVADTLRAELEDILVSSHWIGFGLGVVMPDYKAVLQEYPIARRFYAEDPTVAAYSQIMYEVAREVRKKAKGFGVAYIVDDSSYSDKIRHAFDAMKVNHPTIGVSAKTCAPFDDKDTPALQMADLLANVTKDIFLEWLPRGGPYAELGKWHDHFERFGKWDKKHMVKSLGRNLTSPRFVKGTIARQPVPQIKMTKSERKQKRRILPNELIRETRND
jgi:hypothetical protein